MTKRTTIRFTDVPAPPESMPAWQNLVEFGALWEMVASRPHARVLEIGSLFGGTLWYWSHLPAVKTLIAVDLPSDWDRVRDGVRSARPAWNALNDRCAFVDIRADSQDPATRAEVLGWLPNGEPIDFAFIDGDHTYEGVRADWLFWSPLVAPGGIVAFHDTWPNFDRHEPGVVRWVDELRHHLPSIQWTDPDGAGICVFTMPE